MEENSSNINQSFSSNPSEQGPTAPPNPAVRLKSKVPILIIGIVIFLFLIGITSIAFILLSKSNTNQDKQTEILVTLQPTHPQVQLDWKTYTSPSGYTIQYPPDFKYKESSSGNVSNTASEEISFWKSSEELGEYMGSGKYFTVRVFDNDSTELKTWLKNKWLEYDIPMDSSSVKANLDKVVEEGIEVDINEQKGLIMKHPYDESIYLVFIQGGNKVGKFTCVEYSPGIAEDCEKSYKTFSFTKYR